MAVERISKGWLVAGTLAAVGGYQLVVVSLGYANLQDGLLPYVPHVVGAAAAGSVMSAHAPLRPWREPLVAGVVSVAILALLFLALPHPEVSWVAARSAHPLSTAIAIALLAGASSMAGAALIRKIAPAARTGTVSLLALSGLVTCGALTIIADTGIGFGVVRTTAAVPAVCVGVFAGGFLTQSLASTRRPWVCGGGMLLFLFPLAARTLLTPELVGRAALSGAMVVAIGAWGARRAWRRKERNGAIVNTEIPAARIEL